MRTWVDLDLPKQIGKLLCVHSSVVDLARRLQNVTRPNFHCWIALCISMRDGIAKNLSCCLQSALRNISRSTGLDRSDHGDDIWCFNCGRLERSQVGQD